MLLESTVFILREVSYKPVLTISHAAGNSFRENELFPQQLLNTASELFSKMSQTAFLLDLYSKK